MSRLTVAFSTSSPQTSIAIFSAEGELLWADAVLAPNAASGALVRLLDAGTRELGFALTDATRFVADLGPGSFTGVRVGIVFAKVLAFGQQAKAAGASAFDLISPDRTVFIPSRRGEVFVRELGRAPVRMPAPPAGAIGYEYGSPGVYPHAAGFGVLLAGLKFLEPELLLPEYLSEPSISLPKRPYGEALV